MNAEKITLRGPESKLYQRICLWLARAPKTVERLILSAAGMPEHVVLEMTADDCAEMEPDELAQRIVGQVADWSEGQDRECRFNLAWYRAETPVITMPFRYGISLNSGGLGTQYDGTSADIIGQLQRHLEVQQKTLLGTVSTVLQAQNYVIEQQRIELQEARAHKEKLAEREEELRLEQLQAILEEVETGDAEKLMKLMHVGTEIVKQFKAGIAETKPETH